MALHNVVVHGLEHARAVLEEAAARGDQVVLVSAEGAALFAGAGWFRELATAAKAEFPSVLVDAILDCGDAPGAALGALRTGVKTISLECSPEVRAKISAVAEHLGARLVPRPPQPILDIAAGEDPRAAARAWFATAQRR